MPERNAVVAVYETQKVTMEGTPARAAECEVPEPP